MTTKAYQAASDKPVIREEARRVSITPWLAALVLVLLLTAYLLSAAFRTPPPWSLQIGTAGDTRFSSGFFLPELSGAAAFRWSGPGARLVLHGADATPLVLALRLNGDQVVQSGNPRFSLVPDQQAATEPVSTTFAVTTGWRNYRVLLPPQSNDSLTPPAYVLDSATHRPGPNDGRDLGVAVGTVRLLPATADTRSWLLRGWPLDPYALFLVWGLGVVFWGIELVGRRQKATVRASPPWLPIALVVVALLAVALVAWAHLSPYTLAAMLPPMPWTLGLLSVALVAGPVVGGLSRWQQAAGSRQRVMLWGGMGMLVVAQVLLNAQVLVWLGGALALLALAMVVASDDGGRRTEDGGVTISGKQLGTSSRWSFILHPSSLILLITLLAFAMRFYDIANLPYGLWRDEARHGLVALRILEDPDYRPVYVAEGGVNMPALIFYPFALAIKLWGIHPWTMRPVTALAGALTVLPLYALVRRLFGVRPALLAALFLAVSAWHITISRFSFPTIFDPLFGLTGLWLLVVGLDDRGPRTEDRGLSGPLAHLQSPVVGPQSSVKRLVALLFSGICFGLAIQTYHTGRVVPIVAGVLSLGILWEQVQRATTEDGGRRTEDGGRRANKSSSEAQPAFGRRSSVFRPPSFVLRLASRWLLSLLIVALGFLLVATPMILYALRQEAAFNDRVSGVFLLSDDALKGQSPLAALDDTLGRHLLMFNVRGDSNGRHAPPNRPALDFVAGLGLLLGCALLLRWRKGGSVFGRDWRGLFLLAAVPISLLPSALAVDAPHGMRSIGAAAFVCVIAALGLEWGWRLLTNDRRRATENVGAAVSPIRSWSSVLGLRSVAAGILALAVALNIYTYFIWMRATPDVWVAFYPVHTQVGAYVADLREREGNTAPQMYVAEGIATNPVFVYLTHSQPIQTFADTTLSEPIRPGAIFILSGYTYTKERVTLAQYLGPDPQPVATGPLFPDGRSPSFVAYRVR